MKLHRSSFVYKIAYWRGSNLKEGQKVGVCVLFWTFVWQLLRIGTQFFFGFFIAQRPAVFRVDTPYEFRDKISLVKYKQWLRIGRFRIMPVAVILMGLTAFAAVYEWPICGSAFT